MSRAFLEQYVAYTFRGLDKDRKNSHFRMGPLVRDEYHDRHYLSHIVRG